MEVSEVAEKGLSRRNNQMKHHMKKVIMPSKKVEFKKGMFPKPSNTLSSSLSRRKSIEKSKFYPLSNVAFNPDPLNLSTLCTKEDDNTSPDFVSPIDRSLNYEPAIMQTYDIHDPLNLNDINDEVKPPRKRKKRKRRNTANVSDVEEIVDGGINDSSNLLDIMINKTLIDESKDIRSDKNGGTKIRFQMNSNKIQYNNTSRSTNIGCVHFDEKSKRYRFGNYIDSNESFRKNLVDERLNFLNKEWFEGKHCLDIGCNTGKVTTLIAKHFSPASIVGVDIDANLIRIAKRRARECAVESKNLSKFPLSFHMTYGPIIAPQITNKIKSGNYFPHNLSFYIENYAPNSPASLLTEESKYDVILCLSVTKWVQLNFGDDGLKMFFKKIFIQLKQGGRLILEPQPYNSYKRKKHMMPEILKNFNEMKMMPGDFVSYLLSSEIGFARSECLTYSRKGKTGFDRPLYLLVKSDSPDRNEEIL